MKKHDYRRNETWATSYQASIQRVSISAKSEFLAKIARIERADIRSVILIKKTWKWDEFDENPRANFESAFNARDTCNERNFYIIERCKPNQREKNGQSLPNK